MIRNDLHIHSLQSLCGIHSLMEIIEIATDKGVKLINLSDHGSANGKTMNFGPITDKRRVPHIIHSSNGSPIRFLAGIEANILNIEGDSDFPMEFYSKFDLVSAGFHDMAHELQNAHDPEMNLKALENYLKRFPLDILTHPNIKPFPLPTNSLIDLSLEYGFALEINNTNLRLNKTNLELETQMFNEAVGRGARLVENSDGHSFLEIAENESIIKFLEQLGHSGEDVFLNRSDEQLDHFLGERKQLRS
ncbi:MAG: PHP domain-containing protein [Candidatus Marinimicrobia bacterium]|nr:PHP domain-containing protein [Candidatus Neomarinimicrobiota bacterium]MCF7921993.1 PHP domain-containing protein [Candidatus Neomarinimicrobiota bacterium]